jgi:hypothetical protein
LAVVLDAANLLDHAREEGVLGIEEGHPQLEALVTTSVAPGHRRMRGERRLHARPSRRSADTLIMARTDAVAVEDIVAAFDRAEAYAECGVDALFIEALRTSDDLDEAGRRFGRSRQYGSH